MQKKCTLITAAAGLVLALGAPVVGALPAGAATLPAAATASSTATPELGTGGHVFTGDSGLVLTSAVYDHGRITVHGVFRKPARDVQIAVGDGFEPAGTIGADGRFSASIASSSDDFGLRFGQKVNTEYFRTVEAVNWYAVAPGTPAPTPTPLPTLTPLPVPPDPDPAPEPLPAPDHGAKQPGTPNVVAVTGATSEVTNDMVTGADESLFRADGHGRRTATITRPTDGTLHVQQSSDGSTFTDRATYQVGGGLGKYTDVDVTLPEGESFLEFRMWVEDASGRKSDALKFFVQEQPSQG
ncbi:hypothetical protein [Curtobacterium herbarum]|uniref:Uncharacterized protein n=1 Tax=Curtobacterium herbarum TaxID=150122 RepID=A0ABP4K1P0_9MICO|nr:hypothetical protein [Curtobacterium herbarum]MBM7475482.1 hypothetical protein [Curtobacterium herbarum]MCS6543398.1 hypothetical protein [Curtobacterium herbarum]